MSTAGTTGVIVIALACNLVIAAAKFIACTMTGSVAMLTEAIHSLVGTSSQSLMVYGLKRSEQPPSGASPDLYFWSYGVAILLFSLGAGVALAVGFDKLLHPQPMTNAHVTYIVLFLALALSYASAFKTLTEFKARRGAGTVLASLRSLKDPALFAIVLQNLATLAGLLIALVGVIAADRLGILAADGFASIMIGFLLAAVAAVLSIEIKNLIETGEHVSSPHVVATREHIERDTDERVGDAPSPEPTRIANVVDAARDGVRLATSAPAASAHHPRNEKKHVRK